MNRYARWLVLGAAALPLVAAADVYKCKAPNGKISYSGQMSMEKGVKCEPIFVKKPPTQIEAQPAPMPQGNAAATQPASAVPPAGQVAVPPATQAAQPPVPPVALPKTPADTELENKRKQQEADEAKKHAEKEAADKLAEQKMKEDNCKLARSNLQTYQRGGRIIRNDEKGEKVYLDDKEIQQKLNEAQQEVSRWCGS